MRDRIAIALANWILRTVATKRTAMFIAGAIEYGMRAAARDAKAGASAPPNWRTVSPTTTTGTNSTVIYRSVP